LGKPLSFYDASLNIATNLNNDTRNEYFSSMHTFSPPWSFLPLFTLDHRIKNSETNLSNRLQDIAAKYRLSRFAYTYVICCILTFFAALTGMPVQNNLVEL
jgi:hypothetical protein